ncbi:glycosyltransferase family 39 protein [Solidesulfovibrio alcoholivorans]|uniref:glycosyltransferase family 39 protein n=1 Tax=Solidesulfovibrio alcoholivorans TaxID=81406 RepID=UPI0005C1B1A0|nr:glycosyltransferase family 39 protein [Solidesulfovibrio alcoholivorans]
MALVTAFAAAGAVLARCAAGIGETAYALQQTLGPGPAFALSALSLAVLSRLLPVGVRGETAGAAPPADRAFAVWPCVLACTLLGGVLRFYARDALPYWWDELLAVWIANADPATILRTLATPQAPASDFTPPLFYLLLHGVRVVWGDGEAVLRFFTALCGTLTIPLTYVAGARLINKTAGCCAALLLALSPAAVYYGQQVRCYSLLGLLTVLTVLALDRAACQPRTGRLAVATLLATLTLYTHFVATWFMAGLAGAFLGAALVEHPRFPLARMRGVLTPPRNLLLTAAIFLAAACCPLFAAPPPASPAFSLFLWAGLGCGAALVLMGLPWCGEPAGNGGGAFWRLAIALAVAAVFFAPWLLGTHIWTVISGPGAHVPGAYGLKELAEFLEFSTGLPLRPGLFFMIVGYAALLVRRPRTALILTGWGLVPLALAMYVQNPSMNLARYLSPGLPVYPLLLAAGILEGLAVPGAVWRGVTGGRSLPRAPWAVTGLALVLVFAAFGYQAFSRIPFPTRRTDYEDYPAIAARLAREPGPCLGAESANLLRAVSWYRARLAEPQAACSGEHGSIVVYNIDQQGNPWHPKSPPVAGMPADAVLLARVPGLVACAIPAAAPVAVTPTRVGAAAWAWNLDGGELLRALARGENVGYGYFPPGLMPLDKGGPARAQYLLAVPEAMAVKRIAVTVMPRLAGPASAVEVRLRRARGEAVLLRLRVQGNGEVSGASASDATTKEAHCRRNADDSATCEAALAADFAPADGLELETTLADDGSGVIYSSEAALRSCNVVMETVPHPGP